MHSFVYLSSCYLFAQKKSILSCDAKRKCFFQVFDSCLEEASPPINTNRLPHKNLIQFCSTKSQQKSSQGGSYCKVRTIIQKTTTVRRSPWASTWWQGQEKKLLTGRNLFQNKVLKEGLHLLWLVGWWGEWSHSKLNLFIPVYCLVPENQDMFPLLVGDHYVGLLTKVVVCVLRSLVAPPSSHWCKWAHQIFHPMVVPTFLFVALDCW